MAKIIIEGKEYETDHLTDETKAQLINVRFVDSELERLKGMAAVLQTARIAYGQELKKRLEDESSDTIKFS